MCVDFMGMFVIFHEVVHLSYNRRTLPCTKGPFLRVIASYRLAFEEPLCHLVLRSRRYMFVNSFDLEEDGIQMSRHMR
jgi:hypothetical protein